MSVFCARANGAQARAPTNSNRVTNAPRRSPCLRIVISPRSAALGRWGRRGVGRLLQFELGRRLVDRVEQDRALLDQLGELVLGLLELLRVRAIGLEDV